VKFSIPKYRKAYVICQLILSGYVGFKNLDDVTKTII